MKNSILNVMKESGLGLEETAILLIIKELSDEDRGPEEIYEIVTKLESLTSIDIPLNILSNLLYISIDHDSKRIIIRSNGIKLFNYETDEIIKIIEYLNKKTNRKFSTKNKSNIRLINGRLEEGYTVEDCLGVIDVMVNKWGNDKKMRYYLRPETLFNSTKFQTYYALYKELEGNIEENDWTIEKA